MELAYILAFFALLTIIVVGWFAGNVFACTFLTLILLAASVVTAQAGGPFMVCVAAVILVWLPRWVRHGH